MGNDEDIATMSLEVCDLAREAERTSPLYGGMAREKSPEWCAEWLCRIGNFASHLSLMSRATYSLDWLEEEYGVSRLDIHRIEHPDDASDNCIECVTIEKMAEAFDKKDAQTFMNEALAFIPIGIDRKMALVRELDIQYAESRKKTEALLRKR